LPSERKQIVSTISLLVLLRQVRGHRIHDPFDCWVTSGYFSAVCVIISTSMAMHNRPSSSKVNRKVQSRPKCRYCRLHLPPCQHLRHLLFILLGQLQQPRGHVPFHCGLVSFFPLLYLSPACNGWASIPNTVAYGRLSHLVIYNHYIIVVHGVCPRSRFDSNDALLICSLYVHRIWTGKF
jgi:hypothetical protein